jgi:hypothetical protein
MALVNPNIAMSFRQPEIQAPNALAQYAQIQQIMGGQQAQELNKLQIQEYQRTREEEEGTRNFLRGRKLSDPDTRSGLAQFGKTGLAYAKLLQEQDTAALNAKNTQSQIDERAFGLQKKKLDFGWNAVGSATTPQAAIAEITKGVKDGVFDMKSATTEIQQLQSMTPEQYQQYRVQKVMGILEAKDKLGFMLPKTRDRDIGGVIQVIQDNPALPGYGQPIAGAAITKTPTIADRNAEARLAFEQDKEAWQRANPTLSLQEDATGLLAVNPRTGVATPVVYGPNGIQAAPAAPAAAPGSSIMRQPTAMTGQRTSAIPGMTSVLDQTSAPARMPMPMPASDGGRVAGAPVGGKREAPAKFNETDMQLSGLAGSLKEFKDEVGKQLATGARFLPAGADTARMQAKYTALLMGVKDLYTLGALAGPDMAIIESQLTNPASWAGKFTSQQGFEEQTKVIEDMLKRTAGNLESTYSRQPKATKKALESLNSGVPGASANNPLGLPGL